MIYLYISYLTAAAAGKEKVCSQALTITNGCSKQYKNVSDFFPAVRTYSKRIVHYQCPNMMRDKQPVSSQITRIIASPKQLILAWYTFCYKGTVHISLGGYIRAILWGMHFMWLPTVVCCTFLYSKKTPPRHSLA